MLYHRELGYGLGQNSDTFWGFDSAFRALKLEVTPSDLDRYRSHFIEFGWGKFDGRDDPLFRITPLGEDAARTSISRRKPIYSFRRLRTYDWSFIGAIAAIIAAILSVAALLVSVATLVCKAQ
jgi:hypothetical protein